MEQITKAFNDALHRFNLTCLGEPKFGWHAKSSGALCRTPRGDSVWLRVLIAKPEDISEKLWRGNEAANVIHGVSKPIVTKADEWMLEGLQARAEIMTYTASDSISDTLPLHVPVTLPQQWWETLRSSLEHLHETKTERICIRQDLVTRRIHERFGANATAEIAIWETSHGDIHWANLTAPDCWILDWESWGKAPKGIDAAFLHISSLMMPDVAQHVYGVFRDWLEHPDGVISQLFALSELMRMTELYGDHPDLYPFLQKRGQDLAAQCGYKLLTPKQN